MITAIAIYLVIGAALSFIGWWQSPDRWGAWETWVTFGFMVLFWPIALWMGSRTDG